MKMKKGLIGALVLASAGLIAGSCSLDFDTGKGENYSQFIQEEKTSQLLSSIYDLSNQHGGFFNYPEYVPLFDIDSNKFKVYNIDVETDNLGNLEIALNYNDFFKKNEQFNFNLKAKKDSNEKFGEDISMNYNKKHNPIEILKGVEQALDYGKDFDWGYFTLENNWENGITVGVTPEEVLEGQGLSFKPFPQNQNRDTQRKYRVNPDDLGKCMVAVTPYFLSYGPIIHSGENGSFSLEKNGIINSLEKN